MALTVLALASGVALVCAIDLVNRAVVRAFVEVIDTMVGRAALQVIAGEGASFPEEVAETVAAVPGVEQAIPAISATAFLADGSGELLTIQGVDLTDEHAIRVYDARDQAGVEIGDPVTFLNQPDSIALTRIFAERHHLEVDDPVSLVTPKGQKQFTVRALLETEGVTRVYGGNLVIMDLYAAERVFTQPRLVNRVDVVVDRDADVSRVADAITATLPQGLRLEAPGQRKADLHRTMRSLQLAVEGLASLGLVAGFLIAFNRLTGVFERRAWQLGVLRAVGIRMSTIWRELMKEGLVLGVLGVTVGIPLGIGLARLLLPIVATMTAVSYKLVAPRTALSVNLTSLLLASGLGMTAAVLAAALPAWRAAQATIATTIRARGTERPGIRGSLAGASAAVLAASTGACVYLQMSTSSPSWGLVATALIAIATACAAHPLLRVIRDPLTFVLTRLGGPTGRLAASSLLENPRRTALMTGTLGVGLGAVVWLSMLTCSFEQSVVSSLSSAMRADLVVTSANLAAGFLEAPVDETLATELRRVDGVAAVAAERVVDWHYADGPIAIDAYDPSYFTDPVFGSLPLLGPHAPDVWEAMARGDGTIISNNLARHLGLNVGDSVTLETPSGPLPLRIVGISVVFISPRGTMVLNRARYAHAWHDTQTNHLFVQTKSGSSRDTVRAAIIHELGSTYALRVLSSGELVDFFAGQVRRAFSAAHVLAAMVLVVVLLGVSDTLAAGVAERTRELGSMRAIGVTQATVARVVLYEAIALGALGLGLALVIGLTLGLMWVDTTFPLLLGWTLERHVPYTQMALTTLATLVVCLLGGLVPAWRAARLRPAVALRYE